MKHLEQGWAILIQRKSEMLSERLQYFSGNPYPETISVFCNRQAARDLARVLRHKYRGQKYARFKVVKVIVEAKDGS